MAPGLRLLHIAAALVALALFAGACQSLGPDNGQEPQPGNGRDQPSSLPAGDDDPVPALARELLSGDVSRAVIEVDTTGPSLTGRARDALRAALEEHGNKSVSFAPEGEAPRRDVYSDADLRTISAETRQTSSSTERLSVHVLVLEGRYEDGNVLGVAFGATSFAIFPDRIRAGILSSVNYDRFEQAVVVHELGHLFGLVNLTGQGGFHEDPDNPGHSRHQDSVMHWAVEDISIGNVFRGGPPTTFHADDRREMRRIRD